MEMKETFKRRSYKLVPPDGGYGYMIVVAVSLNLVTATMFYVCFAVIFKDLFIKLGMGTTSISLVTGVRALSVALSGILTGPLLKVLSRRKLAFIGSLFLNTGVFGTVFVETQAQFIVCQGFLQTIGLGFLYNVSCTLINDYFVEKRLLTTSIMNTLAAAATMVAPVIISWSMAEYGFRGTLIIISAVSIQSLVGSALLQPVAWHMKKVAVDQVQEKEVFLLTSKEDGTHSQTRCVRRNDVDSGSAVPENETNKSAENVATSWKNMMNWSAIKKYMRTCTCYGIPTAVFADILFIYNLAQSLYALKWNDSVRIGTLGHGIGRIADEVLTSLEEDVGVRAASEALVPVDAYHPPLEVTVTLAGIASAGVASAGVASAGVAAQGRGDDADTQHRTQEWNFAKEQVQWSFAVIAFGDLATRILFIFSTTWLKILENRLLYVIGLLVAIATKLAMLWVRDYIVTLAVLAVMGISRCIIVVIFPLAVAECVQPEEFPSAFGISFGLYGLICIILGPIIGVIRDRTGSYMIMFIIIIVIFSMITVAWSIEILRDYRRGKTQEPVPMRREIRSMSICV